MNRMTQILSRGLLLLGAILILSGLIWSLWGLLHRPPAPVVGDQGAVVLAVTAPLKPTQDRPAAASPTPQPTTVPIVPTLVPTEEVTEPPESEVPTPDLLPDWTVTPSRPAPSATVAVPAEPSPTAVPTPTPLPEANTPPTRIVAPSIKLDATVVPMGWEMVDHKGTMVSEWVVPKNAAGWHTNSGLPGQGENVVISGHHNIEGKVFRYVVDLQPGDPITLYAGEIPYGYIVTEKYILKETGMPLKVRQKNAQWIMPTGDERLTLVTCWPYEWPGNTHRVIVVARPAEEIDQGSENRE